MRTHRFFLSPNPVSAPENGGHATRFVSVKMCLWAAGVLAVSSATFADVPPDYGIDFVTIGDVNNPAYDRQGDLNTNYPIGRGSVGYEYRIAKTEINTGQWLEFINTFSTRYDGYGFFALPTDWGAGFDGSYQGPGRHYMLAGYENAAELPVIGISWYDAALYCNWLHNGKSTSLDALTTGAYDTTTWGLDENNRLTDDTTHLPGAKYWIPTADEWIKAVHYDPDKNGLGQGGWWLGPYGSDELPVAGAPDEPGAQTNAGTFNWQIPLGSYPDAQTPYGLLDASGGGGFEWIEDWYFDRSTQDRMLEGGSVIRDLPVEFSTDWSYGFYAVGPNVTGFGSFRIASTVPAPTTTAFLTVTTVFITRRRRS